MDHAQLQHNRLQQVHSRQSEVPYVSSHSIAAAAHANGAKDYPIFLTTWHLVFATIMTQILARFTTILDSRKKVPMTGRVYLRAIVPIGIFFSMSLICGNQAYLYLSVAFIQMLKVCKVYMATRRLLTFVGHHARRCPHHHLGSWCCARQPQDTRKHLLHRYRCRHRLNGRDPIRHDRFPLPGRRYRI
jgi:hypothetical protein